MASTPTDISEMIRNREYIQDNFDLNLGGTIRGNIEVPDGCSQFDPQDVTIYVWESGEPLVKSTAQKITPTPRVSLASGNLPPGFGLSGNGNIDPGEEIESIPTTVEYVYDVNVDYGQYMIGIKYDGSCKATWKRATLGAAERAYAPATVTPMSRVTRVDFTLQLHPDITFEVSGPSSIDVGGSTALRWSVDHSDHVTISPNVGTVKPDGSTTVKPSKPTTYKLEALGLGEPKSETVTVDIKPPQIDSFEVAGVPNNKVDVEQPIKLVWQTTNATDASISPSIKNRGPVKPNDHAWHKPRTDTTYTLTAKGPGGTTTQSIDVEVKSPSIDKFEATETRVRPGTPIKFTWRTSNATDASISPSIKNRGPVKPDDHAWHKPQTDTTYTLTAENPDGETTTQSIDVKVKPPTIDTFTASDTQVKPGKGVKFTWRTTGASDVSIAPPIKNRGPVKPDDYAWDHPTSDTTYTLTAENPDGETRSQSISVDVTPEPTVDISADPDTILRGHQSATLTWNASHVDYFKLNGQRKSGSDRKETVRPSSDTTYTIEAHGPGGVAKDSVTVDTTSSISGVARVELVHANQSVVGRNLVRHTWVQQRPMRYVDPILGPGAPDAIVTGVRNDSRVIVEFANHSGDRAAKSTRIANGGTTNAFDGMTVDGVWEAKSTTRSTTNVPHAITFVVGWTRRV